MKIKIVIIDLELPRWARRALAFTVPAALVLGPSTLVRADTVTVTAFMGGEILSAAKLNGNLQALADAINNPNPSCPRGYAQTGTAAPFLTGSVACAKDGDQVVKVGSGASAFWIDRYEASVWTAWTAGTQIQDNSDVAYFQAGLPQNGQVVKPLYARSVPGVKPSRQITWFQAVEACAASGKRLPNGVEWLRAARGTQDPGVNNGTTNTKCNTSATVPRDTNGALGATKDASCVSDWGAEDVVGNLWEWTAEWYAGLGNLTTSATWPLPPASYSGDGTFNITSGGWSGGQGVKQVGLPAAATRGGYWGDGALGGIFAMDLSNAPSVWAASIGLRCVLSQ